MNCEWSSLTKDSVCIHPGCGEKLPKDLDGPPVCVCRGRLGWGDHLANVISVTGIKKCGGCTERQEFLNRFDEKVHATIDGFVAWLSGEE